MGGKTKPMREHRAALGMSITRLAMLTGSSTRTVLDIEQGKRSPKCSTMAKMASALGVEVLAITEFAECLGIGERQERRELGANDLYHLYSGDEEFRRYAEARRTVAGAEIS